MNLLDVDLSNAVQNARTILSLMKAVKSEAKEIKKLFDSGVLPKLRSVSSGSITGAGAAGIQASKALFMDILNSKQKSKDELEIFTKIKTELVSGFERAMSITRLINGLLGGGASRVVQGFQTALTIVQTIIQLINAIGTISSILSFIPGAGAFGALQHGGYAARSRLYQWNERGKELFVSTTGGYVLDAGTFSSFASAVGMFAAMMEREREYMSITSTARYSSAGDVYISANLDSLRFFKSAQPKYGKYQKFRRR